MHTVTLNIAANGNQVVKINRTKVMFINMFIAKLAKMQPKKMLTIADMPEIGKYTIIAIGGGRFKMTYAKGGLSVIAAIITIKGNKIVAVEGK